MKLGNKKFLLILLLFLFNNSYISGDDKILSAPLINLEKLKPSFEEVDETIKDMGNRDVIKSKNNFSSGSSVASAQFIGLDKITAKSSKIKINLGEKKLFGPLEIKVLKCGKIKSENSSDNVAYLQVKDLTKNENEKVFIFNGWTFSSDPNLTPFDHAIYDLQLINCNNV